MTVRSNRYAVRQQRTMPSVIAECQYVGCGWYRDVSGTSNSELARAAAKRHVEGTGHSVLVERKIVTYLEPSTR